MHLKLCLLVVPFCAAYIKAEEPSNKLVPVVVFSGIDSSVHKKQCLRCRTKTEMGKVWCQHRDGDKTVSAQTIPEIDFSRFMLIAIFDGESGGNFGLKVVEVLEEKLSLRVRYKVRTYQTGVEEGAQESKTSSYAFVIIPLSGKSIIFEEDRRTLIDGPAVWVETGVIEAVVGNGENKGKQ